VSAPLWIFLLLAASGVFSAAMVVTRRNPVHCLLYLLVTFFSVAAVYVLLHAEFVAAVQVLVYAGGIMVLFLFVILLVDVGRVDALRRVAKGHVVLSVLLTALVVVPVGVHVLGGAPAAAPSTLALAEGGGNLETVSLSLFRNYLLPFEAISILLLVALVGAVVLARARY